MLLCNHLLYLEEWPIYETKAYCEECMAPISGRAVSLWATLEPDVVRQAKCFEAQ